MRRNWPVILAAVIAILSVFGVIGATNERNDAVMKKNPAVATAQHERDVAATRAAFVQRAADSAEAGKSATKAGRSVSPSPINPIVKEGLEKAWQGATGDAKASICLALKTNPVEVVDFALDLISQNNEEGVVTGPQVLTFYRDKCSRSTIGQT